MSADRNSSESPLGIRDAGLPIWNPLAQPTRKSPHACPPACDTLQAMQQAATAEATPSFAGLLASLAAPAFAAANPDSIWNEDGLADDVAVLSAEGALRSNLGDGQEVRERPLAGASSAGDSDGGSQIPAYDARSKNPHPESGAQSVSITEVGAEAGNAGSGQAPRDLKRTSITVRLTEAECAQLRARAAESGLTISAYMRSCTVEIEGLRAQVKEALAEMKSAAARENHSVALRPSPAPSAWFMRLLPRRRAREIARA
jgi:hypothetical protein